MRWTKKEREAIKSQIKEYEKKIEDRRYVKLCIFCHEFNDMKTCKGCPNIKISHIFNIYKSKHQAHCFANDEYFTAKFNLPMRNSAYHSYFIRNLKQLKFRCQMWQDSLDLTKREFVKKYKGGLNV